MVVAADVGGLVRLEFRIGRQDHGELIGLVEGRGNSRSLVGLKPSS
jgi:hypothetical protein